MNQFPPDSLHHIVSGIQILLRWNSKPGVYIYIYIYIYMYIAHVHACISMQNLLTIENF